VKFRLAQEKKRENLEREVIEPQRYERHRTGGQGEEATIAEDVVAGGVREQIETNTRGGIPTEFLKIVGGSLEGADR